MSDENDHQMRMNGMSPSGLPLPEQVFVHIDKSVGLTIGKMKVQQLEDGTWEATEPIGSIFGVDVEGECRGTGPTEEAALEALAEDRIKLTDSLWA